MSKGFRIFLLIVIFGLVVTGAIVYGAENSNNCQNTRFGMQCEACTTVEVNPIWRPASFVILHWPNIIKGQDPAESCNIMMASVFFILDIPFYIFFTFLVITALDPAFSRFNPQSSPPSNMISNRFVVLATIILSLLICANLVLTLIVRSISGLTS